MPPLLEARHLRKVFRSGGQRFGPSTETIAVSEFSLSIDAARALLYHDCRRVGQRQDHDRSHVARGAQSQCR